MYTVRLIDHVASGSLHLASTIPGFSKRRASEIRPSDTSLPVLRIEPFREASMGSRQGQALHGQKASQGPITYNQLFDLIYN